MRNIMMVMVCFLLFSGCETLKGVGSGLRKDISNTTSNVSDVSKAVVKAPGVAADAIVKGSERTAKAAKDTTMAVDSWMKKNMW